MGRVAPQGGHVAAAPPKSVMNSRRFIAARGVQTRWVLARFSCQKSGVFASG